MRGGDTSNVCAAIWEDSGFSLILMLLSQFEAEVRRKTLIRRELPELLFGRAAQEQTHSKDSFVWQLAHRSVYTYRYIYIYINTFGK